MRQGMIKNEPNGGYGDCECFLQQSDYNFINNLVIFIL